MLITEGETTQTFVEYRMAPGVSVEDTNGLYVPGSVIKTLLGDKTSPILYGYDQNALAVLIKNGPVLSVGGGGGGFGGGGGGGRGGGLPPGVGGGELQPMSAPAQLTTLEGGAAPAPPGTVGGGGGRGGRGGGGGFAGGAPGVAPAARSGRAGAPAGARGGWCRRGGRRWRRGGGGGGGGRRRWRTRWSGRRRAGGTAGPRVLLSYPNDRERSAALGRARRRREPHRQRGARRLAARQGPRGALREPSVLAQRAARQLLPVVQRDVELGSPEAREIS